MRVLFVLLLSLLGTAAAANEPPFERTEEREPCTDFDPLKRPHFGDLHIHTSLSFDSLRLEPAQRARRRLRVREGRTDRAPGRGR